MSDQHDARFIREVAIRYVGARRRCLDAIREPANVAAYRRRRIHDDAREHFVAIYLDGRHRPVADCVVSIGTATASLSSRLEPQPPRSSTPVRSSSPPSQSSPARS
jgi:DNA repair protein RadC